MKNLKITALAIALSIAGPLAYAGNHQPKLTVPGVKNIMVTDTVPGKKSKKTTTTTVAPADPVKAPMAVPTYTPVQTKQNPGPGSIPNPNRNPSAPQPTHVDPSLTLPTPGMPSPGTPSDNSLKPLPGTNPTGPVVVPSVGPAQTVPATTPTQAPSQSVPTQNVPSQSPSTPVTTTPSPATTPNQTPTQPMPAQNPDNPPHQ